MEHLQVLPIKPFYGHHPTETELEKASNAYLMSLLAIMAGMPLPIINLFASLLFYLGNRRSTWFVRWHCTQTLLAQLTVLVINSIGFTWTMQIFFGDMVVTNDYIGYIITLVLFNLFEFVTTMYAAIKVRKGEIVNFWFWGSLATMVCPPPRIVPQRPVSTNQNNDPI
jgi:uncharacterized membrane protein